MARTPCVADQMRPYLARRQRRTGRSRNILSVAPQYTSAGSSGHTQAQPGLKHAAGRRKPTVRLPGPESIWWIAAVAALFTCAQLLAIPLHMGLSWDEVVYVSQVSAHVPAAFFDPARSRGIPLLVAPVALLTSSIAVLRAYLAVASGAALFGALIAWRRLRPAWVLALAGLMFSTLWVTLYYGPQAMPDEWLAFASLAAVGLFLRAVTPASPTESGGGPNAAVLPSTALPSTVLPSTALPSTGRPGRWTLALLALVLAAGTLVRPGDAVFLVAVLAIAGLAVRSWRHWSVIVAIVAGFAAGAAEWIVEAYLRFGGPLSRLHLASAEQGGFGLHLGAWYELKAVNGPTLCRPCSIGWRYPELGLWWLALPVLVVGGIIVARQAGRAGSLLAGLCSLALASQYLIGVDYAAPRFLIPAYALAAVPVADLLAWVFVTALTKNRPGIGAVAIIALTLQIASQLIVLDRQVTGTVTFHDEYAAAAADLRKLGVTPPCLVNGSQRIPIAFYAGCASTPDSLGASPPAAGLTSQGGTTRFAVLEWTHQQPPAYAKNWRRVVLPGTGKLTMVAYLPPR